MSFSRATLVQRVRNVLDDNPYIDLCAEAMDTTEVGLDVTDGTQYAAGQIVEFQDDGEQCYVTGVSSNTLTVIRNYNFSVTATAGTGTSHSQFAQMAVNPTYKYAQIVDAITAVIRSELYPYVYKTLTYTLTPQTNGLHYYELDDAAANSASLIDVVQVVQEAGTSPALYPFFYGESGRAYPADLHRNLPTTISASAIALYIPYLKNTTNSIYALATAKVTTTYSAPNYSDLTDGVEVDCVTYFTVSRLIASRDVARTTQEDVDMAEGSVRPLVRSQLADYWRGRAIEARNQWAIELDRTVPKRPRSGRRTRRNAR
jgi:hypothetical protein